MIIYSNNQFLSSDTEIFTAENRGLQYGDGVFETMIFKNNSIQYYQDHFQRLQKAVKCMELTNEVCADPDKLNNLIVELIQQNDLRQHARVKLLIHRAWGGLYAPESEQGILTVFVKDFVPNPVQTKEYVVFSDDIRNHYHKASMFKLLSSGRYVMAGLEMKRRKANDIIITDIDGNVSETLQANLFWIKNNSVFTPGIETGCIDGVMRKQIQLYCNSNGIPFHAGFYNITALEGADVVFAANVAGLTAFAQIEKVKFRTEHALLEALRGQLI
ncbi:MAG: aminotransferase class IV [Cytophaga sp.]|uniref:aminotransferase class IV n=1 Tax=Cytophaga sp. TaxID=29535 RepID=UPI003F819BBA